MNANGYLLLYLYGALCIFNVAGEDSSSGRCVERKVVVVAVNTSVLEMQTYTEMEDCFWCWSLNHPFQRAVTRRKLVPVTKTENVTRVVSVPGCCEGWTHVTHAGGEDECVAKCSGGCGHGRCSAPFTCTCDKGFTGPFCAVKEACPNATWGASCDQQCSCENGGLCSQVDGSCSCLPGYEGDACEAKCGANTYGAGCGDTCSCGPGHVCHHVTGDCLRCEDGRYGAGCRASCHCDTNGTALCSHLDGRCFCEGNYFGERCDLFCPFGFDKNMGCLKKLENSSCSCPSDLWKCDPEHGCVCPMGQDCGIEERSGQEVVIDYIKMEEDKTGVSTRGGVIAAIVISLVVAGTLVACLITFYYRRRLGVMQTDLANRTGQHNYTVDISGDVFPAPVSGPATPAAASAHNPLYVVNYSKPDKNVNITREKLNNLGPSGDGRYEEPDLYQEPRDVTRHGGGCLDLYDDLPPPRPVQ